MVYVNRLICRLVLDSQESEGRLSSPVFIRLFVSSLSLHQFCKTVRKLLLSRCVAKATAMLGLCLLLHAGALTMSSAVPLVLLSFLIWMAS